MRRALKYLAWLAAALIAIPLLLVGVVLIGANTDPGRRLIETQTASLTDGMVRIEGIEGRFPDSLRIERMTVADANGVWLTVEAAELDWSPLDLIEGRVAIDRLEAGRVAVTRLPASSSSENSGGSGFAVPRAILSHLEVTRLEIGEGVAGRPMLLTVDGSAELASAETGRVHFAVATPRNAPPAGQLPNGQGLDRQGSDRGAGDRYIVEASMDPARVHATLHVSEAPRGLIAGLAQLPDLGAVAIDATVDGPLGALAAKATIGAGLLRANLNGTVDMVSRAADLAFAVTSPAMTPAPDIAWSSIRLEGKMHGPFVSPEAAGVLTADGLTAAGATIGSLRATISGDASGKAELRATMEGLRVPGPSPDLLAEGSLTLDATARLAEDKAPVRFSLRHALFSAEGTAGADRARFRLTMPELAPFARVGGVDIHGQTALDIDVAQTKGAIDLAVKGGVGITGGMDPVPALIGKAGTIDLAATLRGENVMLTRLSIDGGAVRVSANGQLSGQLLNADWTVSLTDLGAIRPGASGTMTAQGHAGGPLTSLSVTCDLTGDAAAEGGHVDKFTAHLNLDGLPDAPTGQLTASGTVLGAPLAVEAKAEQRNGGFHVVIDRAAWKSLTAGGTLDMAAGETLPTGKITLEMTRLADLAPVIGQPVAGSVTASLDSSSGDTRIDADVAGVALPGTASVAKASLRAIVANPSGLPTVDGVLTLDGVEAAGVHASGRLTAKGRSGAIALTLGANVAGLPGSPVRIESAGTVNATARELSLASLQASLGRDAIRLLAPVRIGFANGVTVDRLRLGLRQGELTMTGGVGSGAGGALDVKATLTNLPVDLIAIVSPSYAADGTIAGEAQLTGSAARPRGTVRVAASGLRMRAGSGRGLPAASLALAATLDGSNARLDGKLTAGGSNVSLSGLAPTAPAGHLDLLASGSIDLAMLNPFLAAQGRDVRGRMDLALAVGGTVAAPRPSGTVRLANGSVQDASFGAHISAINASVRIDGDTVRLERLDGQAGPGTISGSGTVRFPQGFGGNPVHDLTLRASNAKIISSDLMTALIDANLTVRGEANGNMALGGTVLVREANIQVPEKLPPSIAVLPVRDAGARRAKQPPMAPPAPDIALNLTLDAPSQVYIRGRGIDAELGGRVVFAGTAASPQPQGGLRLRRGTFSLAGQSLNLTEGTIDFSGGGLTNPSLKLVATSVAATQTSTLTISGVVRNPKIALSSVPDLPQDEILSQLLFKTARSKLSPFQLASIASALASISGVSTGGGDPLDSVRSALGLDQLSVGSGAGGGATLEAGRYLMRGVRVGATQGATGGSTQAKVQIDLAKGLKLETTAGTPAAAGTSTPGTSNGTSVGVTYQFEY